MITPSFALTATERILPRMALDFTTATLDSRVTFTRTGNTATVTNSSGVIAAINANLPRFDFDPTTLVCKGLLIEEARTNLLLNSLIDGTSLATQLVTTTAVAHTLSFYGTGTIVLTGTSSATVVGTGAYPARQTLTFTPTAGVLTLTVTGTVQYAQLETGAFATSFIPTDATSKTRNADVATMTGTNFSDWYNAVEGAVTCQFDVIAPASTGFNHVFMFTDNTANNTISFLKNNGTLSTFYTSIVTSGASQAQLFTPSLSANTTVKMCIAYKLNSFAGATNGATLVQDAAGTIPTIDRLLLGGYLGGVAQMNGHLQKFFYYPQRIINAEVTAFSK